jgi:oxygen-dependent protoporphyrinogen oxidase
MAHVVVIGGGISGLAAAHALRDSPHQVTVLEGSPRIGGKLLVNEVAGTPIDAGAEAMLARAPEGAGLARAVGLGDLLVSPATSSASLLIDGALTGIPPKTVMGIPADPDSIRVLSPAGLAALRAGRDTVCEPIVDDVSVRDVVAGQLGHEVVDRMVEPLLGGVYAGRAEVLSLRATVPAIAARLREHGSVLAAAAAVLQQSSSAPRPSGPVFTTLRTGLGRLPEAVAQASGAQLRLRTPARRIERTTTGYRVIVGPAPEPEAVEADAVIVAAPASKAAPLLSEVAPWAAHELAGIDYAHTAIVTLAYRRTDFPAGSGVLVPATEGRAVKALTFSSQKWAHLAGEHTLIRASLGRHGDQRVLQRDDSDLAALAAAEVAAITGVRATPVDERVTRWGGALPQYAVGHLDRVRRIRADVARVPRLEVCGAAYDGVGVPACIRTGQEAAARALDALA